MTKKRVLFGGNADSVAMATAFFSNREKFSIMFADDGPAAISNIRVMEPDLAILDLDLPKRGGDECCKTVRQPGSTATLIALMYSPEKLPGHRALS